MLYRWEKYELVVLSAQAQPSSHYIVVPGNRYIYARMLCEVAQTRKDGRVMAVMPSERSAKRLDKWLKHEDIHLRKLANVRTLPPDASLRGHIQYIYGNIEDEVDKLVLGGYPNCGYLLYAGSYTSFVGMYRALEPLLAAGATIVLPDMRTDRARGAIVRAAGVLGLPLIFLGQVALMNRARRWR